MTDFELKVAWALGQVILVLGVGFLAYHRGRHVQSNLDRRVAARNHRRFSMAQTLEYGQSATYRLNALGQSGRAMPAPANPTVVLTPPEVAAATFSPDGQLLHVSNKNQTDNEINVAVAVSAGGLAALVNLVCRPETAALLTLELVEEQAG